MKETKRFRFVIHVGPWKTGSTALQKFFADNRSLLKSLHVYYPIGLVDQNAHHEIPSLITDSISRFEISPDNAIVAFIPIISKFFDDAKENNCTTILISSEVFSEFSQKNYAEFLEQVRKVEECEVELVYFNFDPLSRTSSFVNEIIRAGEYVDALSTETIFNSIQAISSDFDAAVLHQDFIVRKIDYFGISDKKRIYSDFLSTLFSLNSEWDKLNWKVPDGLVNKSLSPALIQELNQFNKFNIGERSFDSNCPVIYTDLYPNEKARFLLFLDRINVAAERDAVAAERDAVAAERDAVAAERDGIKDSRIWKYSYLYRKIRG